MIEWGLLISGSIALLAGVVVRLGQVRQGEKTAALQERLEHSACRSVSQGIDLESLDTLPPPVRRYFRHVLTEGQPLIRLVRLHQSGRLRPRVQADKWLPFSAEQRVVPAARSFVWNARLAMPLAGHVRIVDSYIEGQGFARLSLLSAFTLAADTDRAELNAGELHRYLAEGVWFPTALLPQSGVTWTPLDEQIVLATLTDHETTVSLEFRFDARDEVIGIYSPGRFGRFDGAYRRLPWEGHFRDYRMQGGMRIPLYGEVGWYLDGALQLVWKGELVRVDYELAD